MLTFSGPYGPLQPLREYSLANARPITPYNIAYLLIPLIPLGLQAYLLQFKGTKGYRAALGMLGIGLMSSAGIGYRFVGECQVDEGTLSRCLPLLMLARTAVEPIQQLSLDRIRSSISQVSRILPLVWTIYRCVHCARTAYLALSAGTMLQLAHGRSHSRGIR